MKYLWSLTDKQYDALNPPPSELVLMEDGVYMKMLEDEKWLWMGYVPMPKNRLQWFIHHFIHGLWMGFPIIKVILFSLDKRNNTGTEFHADK